MPQPRGRPLKGPCSESTLWLVVMMSALLLPSSETSGLIVRMQSRQMEQEGRREQKRSRERD